MSRLMWTFSSLFCGVGGLDLGFTQAGFQCVSAFDADPIAVEVYRLNFGRCAKVQDLSEKSFSATSLSGIDVLLAGPPCQGFSTAGKRNVRDPRNNLLLIAGRIATVTRPRAFVAENVIGVLSGKHSRYWKSLERILKAAGYYVKDYCCDSNKLGVPQIRKRMFMLAFKHKPNEDMSLRSYNGGGLRDALANINGAPNHMPHYLRKGSKMELIAKHILPGQKLCNVRGGPRSVHTWTIPEVFGDTTDEERQVLEIILRLRRRERVRAFGDADPVPCTKISVALGRPTSRILKQLLRKGYLRRLDGRIDLTHTFNGKFRRLKWDEPSPTVDTRFGEPRYYIHPDEQRGFTVREAARIQGFPDTYIFIGTQEQQFDLVGNAVPPPMAKHIAEYVFQELSITEKG